MYVYLSNLAYYNAGVVDENLHKSRRIGSRTNLLHTYATYATYVTHVTYVPIYFIAFRAGAFFP
jgi:hypothetical protein